MSAVFDFPAGPFVGQKYTAPNDAIYQWDGYAWVIGGFFDSPTQQLANLGDLLAQIRTLLQDVDSTGSSGYRYSTDSIVTSLNQGLLDMYRMRPDLFLEVSYKVPQFTVYDTAKGLGIEPQYIPPLIMYAVGLVQARDDEQTQDNRAIGFLKIFQQILVAGSLA